MKIKKKGRKQETDENKEERKQETDENKVERKKTRNRRR